MAGCGFATYVIQAYCSSPLKGFGDRHPRVALSLYIDDFTGVVTSRDDDYALEALTEGMVDLRGVIEDELRCCIAYDKSHSSFIQSYPQASQEGSGGTRRACS